MIKRRLDKKTSLFGTDPTLPKWDELEDRLETRTLAKDKHLKNEKGAIDITRHYEVKIPKGTYKTK